MPGTLSVVATPIGNLEDITLRALRVLRESHLIAAEDTRRTAKLLNHYGISTPALSFHAHNARARLPQLLSRLAGGENIALVTDAGTPGVSDPGIELVQACVAAGVPVDPIPGACAPIAAAVASGFPLSALTILGFPPLRSKERKQWMKQVDAMAGTVVLFEAPHRIIRTVADICTTIGNRPICIAREVTKAHQEFLRGTTSDAISWSINTKGEFTVVLGPPLLEDEPEVEPTAEEITREFVSLNQLMPGKRHAAAAVAAKLGLSVNKVYAVIEKSKAPT